MLGDFDYTSVRSVEEACSLLGEHHGQAAVLAGGTDLLVELRNRLRSPKHLIDIKRIEELAHLDTAPTGPVTIGANIPLNVIAENRDIRGRFPALAEAAESIGTYQLRNRATLAGNLCNASPAADGAPPLLVLGARVEIASRPPSGKGVSRRVIAVTDLFAGVKKTSLLPGEIVTSICIPDQDTGLQTAFLKQQRIRGHDLAVVNVAAAYSPQEQTLRIAIGSCSPTPALLEPIDTSSMPPSSIVEHAIKLANQATSPISDVRASAEYRADVLPVLIRRVVDKVLDSRGGD